MSAPHPAAIVRHGRAMPLCCAAVLFILLSLAGAAGVSTPAYSEVRCPRGKVRRLPAMSTNYQNGRVSREKPRRAPSPALHAGKTLGRAVTVDDPVDVLDHPIQCGL